jgi:APA family basic amino acid/polyamine antiporter
VDLIGALFVLLLSALLALGIRETASSNNAFVIVKVGALLVFIVAGAMLFHGGNFHPFAPNGWGAGGLVGGNGLGIIPAAALVFFSYIGFDTATTTAEETRVPQRDVPIGVIGSLAIGTLIYCSVAFVLVGSVPWDKVDQNAALAAAVAPLHSNVIEAIITIGALAGTTSVALTSLLGQTRIFYAMARDGLLPPFVARVHPRFGTPAAMTMVTGVVVAFLTLIVPLDALLELVNIGTFSAFIIVCGGVIWLRANRPDLARPFRSPFVPFFPICGIVLSLFLSTQGLGQFTWLRFVLWLLVGLVIYFSYGYRRATAARSS